MAKGNTDSDSAKVVDRFVSQAFVGSRWASSTYYEHRKVWDTVLKNPAQKAQLAEAIKIGKAPGGEWHPFYKLCNP